MNESDNTRTLIKPLSTAHFRRTVSNHLQLNQDGSSKPGSGYEPQSTANEFEPSVSSQSTLSIGDKNESMRIKKWMEKALEHAKANLDRGEVPVGCLFIYKEDVLAIGANDVNITKNPTRHAEMTCIDKVLKWCEENNQDFSQVFHQIEVVVTIEPCIMCASALHQLNVRRIVYGAANTRFGGCASVFNVGPLHNNSEVEVHGGLFADEAVQLLKQFYEGTNPNAPLPKVKNKRRNLSESY